jgi:hypothetical protein
METTTKPQVQQPAGQAERIDPVVLPDVSTQPHPSAHNDDPADTGIAPSAEEQLQKVLPEVTEIAKQVGGFKKLSEIADTLDKMGK